MPIYLIRHGQSEFNAVHNEGDPDPLIFDPRLTPLGIEQAKAARQEASELNIELVVSSPLTRAIETARHIFGTELPHRIVANARELLVHSSDVGRPPSDLMAEFPDLDFNHLDDIWWHRGPQNENGVPVEPMDHFQSRMRDLIAEIDQITERPAAVVAHANVIEALTGDWFENCEIRLYQP